MNCVHCGGIIDSQMITCPYCGSVNQAGEEFQEILNKRIKNATALKEAIYKQQTPKLTLSFLTKIIVVEFLLLTILLATSAFLWIMQNEICEELTWESKQELPSDSYAETLSTRYTIEADGKILQSNLVNWSKLSYQFMENYTQGNAITEQEIKALTLSVMYILDKDADAYSTEAYNLAIYEINTLFRDVLGFTDEEMALFDYGEEQYGTVEFTQRQEQLVLLVVEKLSVREVSNNE